MLDPPLFLLFFVMVHLGIRKRIIDVGGYDDMRRIWKGGLILRMKGSSLAGGEDVLKFRKVLWNYEWFGRLNFVDERKLVGRQGGRFEI